MSQSTITHEKRKEEPEETVRECRSSVSTDADEDTYELDRIATAQDNELRQTTSRSGHMGSALENIATALSHTTSYQHPGDDTIDIRRTISHHLTPISSEGKTSTTEKTAGFADEAGSPIKPISQGIPPELGNFTKEVVFVLVCSAGQLLFALLLGDTNVTQEAFKDALGLQSTQLPWLQGAFLVALALSVILAGPITDLVAPKFIVVGAFSWLTIWNLVGVFAIKPDLSILFFFVRAMQGLAVGVLVSGSMGILGRVYQPGQRKTRVFSCMAAASPFGFWIGGLKGGALASHLPWIFAINALMTALMCAGAFFTIPHLAPAADAALGSGAAPPSLADFDYMGAACAIVGCICLLFGLTQGPAANWAPYTYTLIIVGLFVLALFFWVEQRVRRPLVPSKLWRTPGFGGLMAAYFLSFGGFVGAWQFYAIQFFLRIQGRTPLTAALYLLPNAICGVLATYLVSRLLHKVPGHYLFFVSMLAFAVGPAMFLPQTAGTPYWALSMPAIGLATFGPDLSFAAASIYITSSVPRSYQGSAGALLMTNQNLACAIVTSVADALGSSVDLDADGNIGLQGLRAVWWLALGCSLLAALITAVWVRIPKAEEKEYET